jgi:TonB family protein
MTCRTSSIARHSYPYIPSKLALLTMALLFVVSNAVMARDPENGPQSSGTGFAVSRQGHILTNYHVVDNCPSIRVTADGEQKELTIVATDKKHDLAIVKLQGPLSNVARFRKGRTIRLGDSIVVVGFPFHGVFASEAHVTTGTVTAMAGPGDDTRFLQITASVQPGNSGGPVLDQSGHIVGIVESKLNALAMALITRGIPQNVNFAIKDEMATLFLNSHGVSYETAVSEKHVESAEIGEVAKQFTFPLTCYSQKIDTQRRALLETERRALNEERQALARRSDQEAREFTLRFEQEEPARIARETVQHKEIERHAAERKGKREQAKKEAVLDAPVASERVLHSTEEERAREAKKQSERQALNAEPQRLEEARRKGQAVRARALSEEGELVRIAKEMAPQIAPLPQVNRPEATLKGFSSGLSNPYWARVQSIISSHWEPPPVDMAGQTYMMIVKFRLQRNGAINDVVVQQSSGNAYFDMAGQRAVLQPRVLPVFPADITEPHQDLSMVFTIGELGR